MITARSADRTYVPELHQAAWNQMPKTPEHIDPRLYRYDGTDLFQWFAKPADFPIQYQACFEPFILDNVPE